MTLKRRLDQAERAAADLPPAPVVVESLWAQAQAEVRRCLPETADAVLKDHGDELRNRLADCGAIPGAVLPWMFKHGGDEFREAAAKLERSGLDPERERGLTRTSC